MATASLNRMRVVLDEPRYRRLLGGQIRAAHLPVPVLPQQTLNSAFPNSGAIREPCASHDKEPILHGELLADHAPVTYQMVRAHIATLRSRPPNAPPPPTVRQVTGWLTRHPSALSEENRADLKNVLAHCPELDAAGHVHDFGEILFTNWGRPRLDQISRKCS
ncbi:hypothetical protein [Streptomyces sp. A2-16]|uniref:hypothetical protein n=1 Tax=Streptomyces sp. A2-16 TaxID=2781734 RepID=UPI0020138ED4|nr:hypothetical protein [Streptomyces sp. A2-16]